MKRILGALVLGLLSSVTGFAQDSPQFENSQTHLRPLGTSMGKVLTANWLLQDHRNQGFSNLNRADLDDMRCAKKARDTLEAYAKRVHFGWMSDRLKLGHVQIIVRRGNPSRLNEKVEIESSPNGPFMRLWVTYDGGNKDSTRKAGPEYCGKTFTDSYTTGMYAIQETDAWKKLKLDRGDFDRFAQESAKFVERKEILADMVAPPAEVAK